MYHPDCVAASLARLAEIPEFRAVLPTADLHRGYTIDEARALTAQLKDAGDPDTLQPTRPLTSDETRFIMHERLRCPVDFTYTAARYFLINKEGKVGSLYPLWGSQRIALRVIGAREKVLRETGYPDAILVVNLKARQLGFSTLWQALIAHKALFHMYVRGLIAADVPEQAQYLFSLLEFVESQLPWWLRPQVRNFNREKFRAWDNGSTVKSAAGLSRRGGLTEQQGEKGNIGRGKTYTACHISEVSTWERPEQLDDAFLPGIPNVHSALVGFESTAKNRRDYWNGLWTTACAGDLRAGHQLTPLFAGWYTVPEKYWLPAPPDWSPSADTLSVAQRAAADALRWIPEGIRLTRDQLYWYEQTKAGFVKEDRLADFYEEYPTTPEEAFQTAGRPIFSLELRNQIQTAQKPLACAFEVSPAQDLALLKQHEREQTAGLDATERGGSPRGSAIARAWGIDDSAPLPRGYGIKLIPPQEFARTRHLTDPDSLFDCLLVWEFPRTRRRHTRFRYVVSADISDGIGEDATSIDVLRIGTIDEPPEQVAQYVSRFLTPTETAFVMYAIGRWYKWDTSRPALLAPEVNNHGLSTQDTLKLHLRYRHVYQWEIFDAEDVTNRWTNRSGWVTNTRTRPIMIDKFYHMVKTVDPITGQRDLVVNSPITLSQMGDFERPAGEPLGMAAAAPGALDDCVLSLAIGNYIAWRLAGGESEPLSERRRRRAQELARRRTTAMAGVARDYRNTDMTLEDLQHGIDPEAGVGEDENELGDPDLWL